MPTIHLSPIQSGDPQHLTDHHNRPGECIISVCMSDGCGTADAVCEELAWSAQDRCGLPNFDFNRADLSHVAMWCAREWQLALADMPAETDRDTQGDDESRYLECHILATWNAGGEE